MASVMLQIVENIAFLAWMKGAWHLPGDAAAPETRLEVPGT